MNEPLVSLKNITRYFQSGENVVKAIDNISIDIFPGEFVAIMGQSGSGKSTLMNILGCLDRPTDGTYQVDGIDVRTLDENDTAKLRREKFGFIFQRYNLLALSDAQENVEIPAVYSGVKKPEREKRARELLKKLGLEDRAEHLPAQLSGGQQQRVAIARALMNDPSVILADEPTGALDTKNGIEVMNLLKDLHREGKTIILITHDISVAESADRIINLKDGKVVSDEIRKPVDRYIIVRRDNKLSASLNITEEINEATQTALKSLRANLFRTSLTLLGIVIGVAAVIIMLAIGNGSREKVVQQIASLGTNIVNIRPGTSGIRGAEDFATLLVDDAEAIEKNIDNIEYMTMERSSRKTIRYGNKDHSLNIQGVSTSFPMVRDWKVERGNFFHDKDVDSYAPVALLGKTAQKTLFEEGIDPIGSYIMIGSIPFEVIGIMSEKGAAPWGSDQDDVVMVPISTGLVRLFSGNFLTSITLKLKDISKLEETENALKNLLLERHGQENFRIRSASSFLSAASASQNTLTILLGAVAAISLLVGGIGVMNIMLVNVTERTREIGIRMATGARPRDILLQFNTEATLVCTLGGIVGVLIGYLGGWVVQLFEVDVVFTSMPAILAFSCAVFTGILFGYLPAKKASRLDPVIALSFE